MKEIVFLEVEDVIEIQRMQIEAFGGDPGILNKNALEAACHAPRNILYGPYHRHDLHSFEHRCHDHNDRNKHPAAGPSGDRPRDWHCRWWWVVQTELCGSQSGARSNGSPWSHVGTLRY